MLVQLSDGTLSVNLSLSWFLAIGAVGAQLLLTSVYTRAVWKWEAKARRDRAVSAASAVLPAAVATRRPARPAPYAERRSIQLASVVPFQSAAASSRDEPLEAALAASANRRVVAHWKTRSLQPYSRCARCTTTTETTRTPLQDLTS